MNTSCSLPSSSSLHTHDLQLQGKARVQSRANVYFQGKQEDATVFTLLSGFPPFHGPCIIMHEKGNNLSTFNSYFTHVHDGGQSSQDFWQFI